MTLFKPVTAMLIALSLTACATQKSADLGVTPVSAPPAKASTTTRATGDKQPAVFETIINDRVTFEKILGNSGLTLQWIGWEKRGQLMAHWDGKMLFLDGEQWSDKTGGKLRIEGRVVEVNKDSFILDGLIEIDGVPDHSRYCGKKGQSLFAITQGRKYFRLREFEWCDRLTDYVDIYF